MKKFIHLFISIIILNVGCKKDVTEEIQGPAAFELKLNQNNIDIYAGQSTEILFSYYKKQEPFKGGILENLYFIFEVIENTTDDNFYSFGYNTTFKVIYFLAPQKSGSLKIKVTPMVNKIPRGEPVILNVTVKDAALNYTALDIGRVFLNYQIKTDQNEITFSNGIVFNQTTSKIRKIPLSIPYDTYNYAVYGYTNENDFILADDFYTRVAIYNPITQKFVIKSNGISFKRVFIVRDIVIGNEATDYLMDNLIYRIGSNGVIEYLGNSPINSVVEKTAGFYLYSNNIVLDYPTDTSKQAVSYTLPTSVSYVKKINGIYYLIGRNDIYSSSTGKDGWVKFASIPTSQNGYPATVCMNSHAFYFLSSDFKTIYKSQSLSNLTLSTINAPMACSSILPLDNGSIIFNAYKFGLVGVFKP